MNGKSTADSGDGERARAAVLRVLEARNKKARFVTEVCAALARSGINAELVTRALAELSDQGAVIMRDHFCADPHLAGVDLRIAAVVERNAPDAEIGAIRAIDDAWDKWLAEYLANHRCT